MLSADSAAGRLLRATEDRRVLVLVSRSVLSEYRAVLTDTETVERFPSLSLRMVEVTLMRLRYVGDYLPKTQDAFRVPARPA